MTHEDKIIEELETEIRMAMIAAKSNPTAPKAEHYSNLLNKFRTTLSTYRTQVLEEVKQEVLELRACADMNDEWCKAQRSMCDDILIGLQRLKHPTN